MRCNGHGGQNMILSAFSLKMEILNKAIIDILSLMHSEPQSRDLKPSTHQDQPESRHLAHCGVGVDLSLQPWAKILKEAQTQISQS